LKVEAEIADESLFHFRFEAVQPEFDACQVEIRQVEIRRRAVCQHAGAQQQELAFQHPDKADQAGAFICHCLNCKSCCCEHFQVGFLIHCISEAGPGGEDPGNIFGQGAAGGHVRYGQFAPRFQYAPDFGQHGFLLTEQAESTFSNNAVQF
jgi:hypothetical protein